ncbi:hypothetical protein HDK90DRAFT_514583 [Phyllosticta capitalensis]|uniref:Uncharacterized protein n=1 Tax=Phyllosticta capitalensis TaxID=121624 RepID=A0ABR1YD94_9PEZI
MIVRSVAWGEVAGRRGWSCCMSCGRGKCEAFGSSDFELDAAVEYHDTAGSSGAGLVCDRERFCDLASGSEIKHPDEVVSNFEFEKIVGKMPPESSSEGEKPSATPTPTTSNCGSAPDTGEVEEPEEGEAATSTLESAPACSQRPTALHNFEDPSRESWEHEHEKRAALEGADSFQFISSSSVVLASIPGQILREIVGGNIAKAANSPDSEVGEITRFYKSSCDPGPNNLGRPGIYVLALVDQNGDAPTPADLTKIARMMGVRPLGINEIDKESEVLQQTNVARWRGSSYRDKGRTFLATEAKLKEPEPGDEASVQDFVKNVLENMAEITNQDTPLGRPIQYFGYVGNPTSRIDQHLDHVRSSCVMSLAESVAFNLWMSGEIDHECMLQGFAICFLSDAGDAGVAEIVLSCIGDGYTESGWGFAYTGAGEIDENSNSLEDGHWVDFSDWVEKNTPMVMNLEAEQQRLVEKDEAYKRAEKVEWYIENKETIRRNLSEALERYQKTRDKWQDAMLKSAAEKKEQLKKIVDKRMEEWKADLEKRVEDARAGFDWEGFEGLDVDSEDDEDAKKYLEKGEN